MGGEGGGGYLLMHVSCAKEHDVGCLASSGVGTGGMGGGGWVGREG